MRITTSAALTVALAGLAATAAPAAVRRAAPTLASSGSPAPTCRYEHAVRYEPNVGQCEDGVRYVARGRGFAMFLVDDGAVFALAGQGEVARLTMTVVGAREGVVWDESPALPGRSNYFLGDDPARWRTGVVAKRGVVERGVLPGVDLAFGGEGGTPEYRFLVAAGVPRDAFDLDFDGADRLSVDAQGDLAIDTPVGRVLHTRPRAWQDGPAGRRDVAARFDVVGPRRARIVLPARDPSLPLVVDPHVEFATYLGGSSTDYAYSMALDAGAPVVVGQTISTNFPIRSAYQSSRFGTYQDAFVSKLRADGSDLVFSTYLGGGNADEAHRVVVKGGAVWVAGETGSTNFPTASPYQGSNAGSLGVLDAFVVKLAADGSSLSYGTYFGGGATDNLYGFDVAADGSFAVAGTTNSSSLPVTGAYQASRIGGATDAYVAKFNSGGASLAFCTFLGGDGVDIAYDLAFDGSGRACVVGYTDSTNFPLVLAAQPTYGGSGDAFVTRFRADGASPETSTYLGGADAEIPLAEAVDASGGVAVLGYTQASNFPTTASAFQTSSGGQVDVVVARYSADGRTLAASTYLGRSGNEYPTGIALGPSGDVFVGGVTSSTDFPLVQPLQSAMSGNGDAFVSRFSSDLRSLRFSTLYGGGGSADRAMALGVDSGALVVAGVTDSTDFPVLAPYQATKSGGNYDAWISRVVLVPKHALQAAAALSYLNDVRVTWAADGADQTGFRVERRAAGGAWETAATAAADATSLTDAGLLYATPYSYRVVAFDDDGDAPPSNEVSVATLPRLPIGPTVLASTPSAGAKIVVSWTDDEPFKTGFEVSRSCDGAGFAVIASPDATTTSVDDAVPPDADCVYRVATLNEFGASTARESRVRARPSLLVKARHGALKDGAKPGKDALAVSGTLTFDAAASPDGVCDPAADGLELRLGSWEAPTILSIPAGDPGWKPKRGAAKWASARGASPAVKVSVDLRRRTFSVAVSKFDLASTPAEPLRVCVAFGNDRGSDSRAWRAHRGGVRRFPK